MRSLTTCLLALGLSCALSSQLDAARDLPEFGLIFNDDGDFSFVADDPAESILHLESIIDSLVGTPVRTLTYCVGAGSDVLYYPTEVASVWGWRETKYDRMEQQEGDENATWGLRTRRIVAGMEAGVDPIRVAAERARENGLLFLPSYRMNDDHFIFEPFDYPLTGEFWIENHEELIIGLENSPILSQELYGNLLDYSHEEVRNHRLEIIAEVIDRYADVMDGIQLDFNRLQVLFPKGTAEERAHLVTDLVRQVRAKLDAAGEREGRDMALMARVPPTPANCTWAGLDIATWAREDLVDVILPAQLMTLAHDMPIDEFVRIASEGAMTVHPSLYPRTSWHYPFSETPSASDYTGRVIRHVSPDLVRGAASNYWAMGAKGFEVFNFQHDDMGVRPFTDRVYRILRDLGHERALNGADRIHAITPAYYLDHEDTYQYRKQIPAEVPAGESLDLTLIVGEAPAKSPWQPLPRAIYLRTGLRDVNAETVVTITLNGTPIHDGPARDLIPVSAAVPANAPTAYLQVPISDASLIRQGANDLSYAVSGGGDDIPAQVTEVWLAVIYNREMLDMLVR